MEGLDSSKGEAPALGNLSPAIIRRSGGQYRMLKPLFSRGAGKQNLDGQLARVLMRPSHCEAPRMTERRKPRRLRYTLRALFVFITLFMVWGGYHTNRSWKERAAEQVLREQGAVLGSDRTWAEHNLFARVSSIYDTVVRLVWRERFITRVQINSPLEESAIEALLALPHLDSLSSEPQKFTSQERIRMHSFQYKPTAMLPPDALGRILAQHQLKELSLGAWILADSDCAAIGKHDSLIGLSITQSSFSERGFADMLTLPRLQSLTVLMCQARGDQVATLPALESLERVNCTGTPVNRHFASFIAKCPQVRDLQLGHDAIGDDFVEHLGPHPSLRHLDLLGQGLTDEALVGLARMPALEGVNLPRSISAEAISQLKSQRPGLFVSQ
jgi:hypothetical protein